MASVDNYIVPLYRKTRIYVDCLGLRRRKRAGQHVDGAFAVMNCGIRPANIFIEKDDIGSKRKGVFGAKPVNDVRPFPVKMFLALRRRAIAIAPGDLNTYRKMRSDAEAAEHIIRLPVFGVQVTDHLRLYIPRRGMKRVVHIHAYLPIIADNREAVPAYRRRNFNRHLFVQRIVGFRCDLDYLETEPL